MERPTLANWMQAPGNRWAFRHVRELIPSARIPARAAAPLPEAPVEGLLELRIGPPTGEAPALASYLEESHTDAFVVLKDGRVGFEWYAAGVSHGDRHIVFSVSKSVTALLAGALAGAGWLDLDGDVADYVPEAKGSGYEDATVRDLLDMSASVRFTEDYSLGAEIMRRYRRATGYIPGSDGEDLHAFLCSLEHAGPHGERFRYLSPTTDMLGSVIERAGGMPYAQALSEHLWTPLGAEADAEVTLDRSGAPRAAGGLSMTARDQARVGQLVLDGGREVIPDWFVEDLFSGGDPSLWAVGDFAADLPAVAYRSCWYELRVDPGVLCAIGIHGQLIYVDRARRVVVAKQSHWPVPDSRAGDEAALAAAAAVCDALG